MNYDRIVLELMNRVQILEEEMAEVKSVLSSREEDIEDDITEEIEQGEFTRSQARNKAIEIIQKKYPDYLVEKASRKEGSGIKVHKPETNIKKPILVKFFHSKTYKHNSGKYEFSWSIVNLEKVIGTFIDFCMFSTVDSSGNWNFFIYRPDELGIYNEENRSSDNNLLHLYFAVTDNNKAKEVRENEVDVSDHLNNWDMLK